MEKLTVNPSSREILKLAFPISIALFIPQTSFFTNNVFMGWLGERELGLNGITGVFYLILSMVGYGLCSGIQIQMARRAGEENRTGLAETLVNGTFLCVGFSLALMVLSLWIVPVLFSFSLNDSLNLSLSVNFIYTRIWGLPFLIIAQLLSSFYIATGKSHLLIIGSIAATAANIVFDYALMFGKLGFPLMGFQGAATASVISEIIYAFTLGLLFVFARLHRDYPVFGRIRINLQHAGQSLKVAAPLIVQFLFSIGGWLVFFFFIEHLGERSLAASQMLRSIFGIVGVGTWALATTCNTMVSNLIGQGRHTSVIGVIKKISRLSLIYSGVLCAILLLFSKQFLSLYSSDISLIMFTIPSLQVIVCATIIMSVSTVAFNGVVGTGNTLVNLSIEVTCVGLYLVYCYYFIHLKKSPLYICWGSEFVYWSALLVTSFLYLRSGRWKGKMI